MQKRVVLLEFFFLCRVVFYIAILLFITLYSFVRGICISTYLVYNQVWRKKGEKSEITHGHFVGDKNKLVELR